MFILTVLSCACQNEMGRRPKISTLLARLANADVGAGDADEETQPALQKSQSVRNSESFTSFPYTEFFVTSDQHSVRFKFRSDADMIFQCTYLLFFSSGFFFFFFCNLLECSCLPKTQKVNYTEFFVNLWKNFLVNRVFFCKFVEIFSW